MRDNMDDNSKFSKFLFKYIFLTDISSLSKKERICIIFIPTMLISAEILYLFVEYSNFYILVFLFGFYLFFAGLAHPLFYFEKYDEKYGFYSKIRFGGTYQMMSKNFSFIIPGLIIIILSIGLILNKLTMAFLIIFAFVLPFFALFFRINVFNDDSSIEGDEVILGYHPTYYGFLSLILGVYGYLNVYSLLKYNLNFAIILFCITIIFQILLLIPDKCNEVLFFEIRRTKGFLAFIIPLILVFLAISSIMTNFQIININNINLSFESIIRTIITWGFGIILALFFVKKIKEMNNFKK